MDKRGVIEGLQALIVPLIGIALVLVIGFLIFAEVKEKVVDITSETTTHSNETFTPFTTHVYKHLIYSINCMSFSCTEVRNGSGGNVVPAARYNCTLGAGLRMGNITTDTMNETLYVDYTCANTSIAYNATNEIQNATQDIPGWLPIIVITVIGALLIGLVTRFRR